MSTQKDVRVVFRITLEEHQKLKELARRDDRPVSSWLRTVVKGMTKDVKLPCAAPVSAPLVPREAFPNGSQPQPRPQPAVSASRSAGKYLGGPKDCEPNGTSNDLRWDPACRDYFPEKS